MAKNKTMWYVDAHMGNTTIHLPCWDGEAEAERVVDTLHDAGWVGPSGKKGSMPEVVSVVLTPSEDHWREFLVDA